METNARHALIGIFTVVVVGAALLFALWLTKNSGDAQYNQYDVIFEEAVSGLSKGAAVEFNGIRVGDVSNLSIKDLRHVIARIRVDSRIPINSDTVAQLAYAGITGIATIRLSSGDDPNSTPLPTKGGAVPVIVARPSPLSRFMSSGEGIMTNINESLFQVRKVLSAENAQRVENILANFEKGSAGLAELETVFADIKVAAAEAKTFLEQATVLVKTGNRVIDQDVTEIADNLNKSLASFERTMASVEKLVADNSGQLENSLSGLGELGPAIVELRSALGSIRSFTQRLENDPAGFLFGRQTFEEFEP